MDDGNGCAPVSLAGDAPVAKAEGFLLVAQALLGQDLGHGVDGGLMVQTIKDATVDGLHLLLVGIPVLPGPVVERGAGRGRVAGGLNDLANGQTVFEGEGKIPLVVGWDAHDRAVAIAHQDVVAHPDRHLLAGDGMSHGESGVHALFFSGGQVGLGHAAGLAGLDEGSQSWVVKGCDGGDGMLCGHGHEGHAHDGVGAGGEDKDLAFVDELTAGVFDLVFKGKSHAGGFANPVFLHQLDALGPAQAFQARDQLVGVSGDAQVVHGDLALFDDRTTAPALAIDHLFVGQHRLIHRIPVHRTGLEVGNALFTHL